MRSWLRRAAALALAALLLVTSAAALSVEQALRLLEDYYLEPLPAAAYAAGTLDELIAAVGDPYTYYMSAEEYRAFTDGVEGDGSMTGLGVSIVCTEDGVSVVTVYPGSGAEAAGLRAGDLILAIDGVSCVPAAEKHLALLSGDAGTRVTLRVRSRSGEVSDRTVTRRPFTMRNTIVSTDGDAATLRCTSFGSQTGALFRDAVAAHAADARCWIVDLRGNPGGLTQSAVDALAPFAGPGNHLYYLDREGRSSPERTLESRLTDSPVIVLLDRSSASAAEIFAGGIRASGAGILIGSRSYGKGTAQVVLDSDFSASLFRGDALRVTAYRFHSADGNTPNVFGVLPTLSVDPDLADRVAALLCSGAADAQDCLRITLCSRDFYVDLAAARAPENSDATAALLSALPPQVLLDCPAGDARVLLSAAQAAQTFGLLCDSRWFRDVASSPYADGVNALATLGILRGDDGVCFRPAAPLTRAELCAMLAQAMDLADADGSVFSDVRGEDWFCSPVNAMAALGLVQGVGGGRFDPNGPLTQEQFFTIMGRFASLLNFRFREYDRLLASQGLDASLAPASYAVWARADTAALSSFLRDARGNSDPMLVDELANIPPRGQVSREQAAQTLYLVLSGLGVLKF